VRHMARKPEGEWAGTAVRGRARRAIHLCNLVAQMQEATSEKMPRVLIPSPLSQDILSCATGLHTAKRNGGVETPVEGQRRAGSRHRCRPL
jgi:hypothetical protein